MLNTVIIITFEHLQHLKKHSWGRFGFDRMFGGNRLRVRALFSVINEQNKLNAKRNNVIEANFAPAYAVAA